jgi:hypothetical protein
MPILTNAQGRKLYVLRRISTSEVLNRFVVYPNAVDDAPIIGFDPDLEYLPIDRDVQPDYDPRVYDLTTSEAKVGSTWKISYATPKKVADQIKLAVQNREATEVGQHLTPAERDKMLLLGLGVLFATQQGVTLTQRQQAIKTRVLDAVAKVLANDKRAADLFADIDADKVPDIDTGWSVKQ